MSHSSSNVNEMLKTCRSLISCSDCNQICIGELSCCHMICDKCCATHTCEVSIASVSDNSEIHLSPSLAFLKGLFEQLTRISATNCRAEIIEKMDGTDTKSPRKNHKHPSTNRRYLNGHNKKLGVANIDDFAQVNDLVQRYLPIKQEFLFEAVEIKTEMVNKDDDLSINDDMPTLERQDEYNYFLSLPPTSCGSDSRSSKRKKQTLKRESRNKKQARLKHNIKMEPSSDESDENIPNGRHLPNGFSSVDGLVSPANSKTMKTRSSNKSPVVRSPRQRNATKNIVKEPVPGPSSAPDIIEETEFPLIGFNDYEILSSTTRLLYWQMKHNKSTCETRSCGAGLEVAIKLKPDSLHELVPQEPTTSQQDTANQLGPCTPQTRPILRVLSPVNSVERKNIDLSSILDQSEVDTALLSFNIPEDSFQTPQSKRQLFKQPSESQMMKIEEVDEEDTSPEHSPIPPRKKKLLNGDEPGCSYAVPNDSIIVNGGSHRTDDSSEKKALLDRLNGLIFKEKEMKMEQDGVSFATCNLSPQEVSAVIQLAKATKSKLKNCFSHETSHLILSRNQESSISSPEYLLAIVHGAIIVNFDWVEECLRENKILSPYGFIPKTEEGPCRCLETTNKPFDGIYFFMGACPHPSDPNYSSYQVTKALSYKGGAHIIQDHEEFMPFVDVESIYPRFYISMDEELNDHDKETSYNLKSVPIKHTWISSSIRHYRALPVMDYLYSPITIANLCNVYKVPQSLVKL